MPNRLDIKPVEINDSLNNSLSGKLANDSRLICNIIRTLDCVINIDYLTKVLKHVPGFEISYDSDSPRSAILFSIDSRTEYIVMPMGKE
jgi:hypothetical protein